MRRSWLAAALIAGCKFSGHPAATEEDAGIDVDAAVDSGPPLRCALALNPELGWVDPKT